MHGFPALAPPAGGAAALAAVAAALGCADITNAGAGSSVTGPRPSCSISPQQIFNGGPGKDGIPALTNPDLVSVGGSGLQYLRGHDRVIGVVIGGDAVAVPLNILWWHEIVNLDFPGLHVAITHCPLTGSSLVFDRAAADGAEFGVSGLLYLNNLLMYDRRTDESLWPQMLRGARCGPSDGTALAMVPAIEMTWAAWRTLHPDTRVVSSNTGFQRDYTRYPYGSYDRIDNPALLFPVPRADGRRPPKERVLGIPSGTQGGIALPFGTLSQQGLVAAVEIRTGGAVMVVFWDGDAQSAMAFHPALDDRALTFEVVDGRITDDQTRSTWRADGLSTDGPLASAQLEPVAEAFVAYWFAWSNFYPEADLWTGQ